MSFKEEFCGFENSMAMENVRLKYKNNLNELLNYKRNEFTDEELKKRFDNIMNSGEFKRWKNYGISD